MAKPEVQELAAALAGAVAEVLLDEERGEFGAKPSRETVAGAIVEAVLRFEVVPLAVAENLAAALKEIVDNCGKVCGGYELCTHVACQSSYTAWAIADGALAVYRAAHPKETSQ